MDYDVSVVIPTLRRDGAALHRAIASCFDQDCMVQVVVVDDSGLPPPSILPGVVWIRQSQPGTLADALNAGHRYAYGDYRFTMDDDDFLQPNGLKALLYAIRKAERKVRAGSFFAYGNVAVSGGPVITPEWTPEINRGQFRTGNAMLWHGSLFASLTAQYHHPEDMKLFFEDYDFCVQLEAAGVRGLKVDTMVTCHRVTAGGVTERARKLGVVAEIRARINARYEG